MLGPLRFCSHVKPTYHASLAFSNYSLAKVINGLASRLYYSKDCCKDIAQTTGRKVEPWPKPDPPPPAWRVECPQEPQPPHYDPYRIKVPDVVVPPLPPSDVKDIRNMDAKELLKNPQLCFQSTVQDLFHNSTIVHPDYWKDKPMKKLNDVVKDVLPKLGYHGRNKYKYAFHEPWQPLDRLTLLEQAEKQEMEQSKELSRKTDIQSSRVL